jgi:hypothetical protein
MLTKVSVDRLFPAFVEAQIDFPLPSDQSMPFRSPKSGGVGCVPPPINNLAFQDHQPAAFDPGNPAMVAGASLADLSLTMPLTDGVNRCNAVNINHTLFLIRRDQNMVSQVFTGGQQTRATANSPATAETWATSPL